MMGRLNRSTPLQESISSDNGNIVTIPGGEARIPYFPVVEFIELGGCLAI